MMSDKDSSYPQSTAIAIEPSAPYAAMQDGSVVVHSYNGQVTISWLTSLLIFEAIFYSFVHCNFQPVIVQPTTTNYIHSNTNATSQPIYGGSQPMVNTPPTGMWRDGICDCFRNLWPSCGCVMMWNGAWILAQSNDWNFHKYILLLHALSFMERSNRPPCQFPSMHLPFVSFPENRICVISDDRYSPCDNRLDMSHHIGSKLSQLGVFSAGYHRLHHQYPCADTVCPKVRVEGNPHCMRSSHGNVLLSVLYCSK